MDFGNGCRKSVQLSWRGAGLGVLVVVLIGGGLGCQDHRISLDEFLVIEQKVHEQATSQPSSQPAALTAEAKEVIDRSMARYKTGPGDVLNVTLTTSELSGGRAPTVVRVTREGLVELPLVGMVKVGEMELEDAEAAIRKAYVPKVYVELVVHVEVLSPEATRVLVHGAVQTPGLVSLRRTERSLLFAIVAGGGVTESASGNVTLRRLRKPGDEMTLNLLDPGQLQAAMALDPLENGDMVSVEASTPNTIFVGGLVLAPRPQPYPFGVKVTVLQALAASGGLRTDVTPREGTLIRKMPDGREVQVKLNLDRITTGKDPNITLLAGDVFWVPDTLETRVQDWINKNIFLRAGFVATGNYSINGLDYMNSNARNASVGSSSKSLTDQYNPFGSLLQNAALQSIQQSIPSVP